MYSCSYCERPINQATEICPFCGADLTAPFVPDAEGLESAVQAPRTGPGRKQRTRAILLWGTLLAAVWAFLWFVLPVPTDVEGPVPAGAEGQGSPHVLRAEARAIESLKEIGATLRAWAEAQGGYPHSLESLGEKARRAAQQAQGEGYVMYYVPAVPGPDNLIREFSLEARPRFGGYRSFYTDATGVIRGTRESRPATAFDPPL